MSDKVKLNIEWLSDCGGCHCAIVDLHEKILDVLKAVEIQRCPILTDIKDYPHAKVGLVSGAIRTEHDRHAAEEMRKSCDLIIAFGTCAVYGGLPGAGCAHTREDILQTVYVKSPTTVPGAMPETHVSSMEATVTPLDEVIDVDLYLPGCPPHPAFIFDALIALIEGREPKARAESVCGRCERVMRPTEIDHIRGNHDGVPDEKTCLLAQGYLCMGSVTIDRCLAPCPNNGTVCTGCAGPTMQVLTEPNRDIRTEIAQRMTALTRIPYAEIVQYVERNAKTFYAYAMANRMISQKPTFHLHKWIRDNEVAR